MESTGPNENVKESVRSWAVVIGLAVGFFLWGLFVYCSVGDKGSPSWSFGVVEDIPGQSTYSTHTPKQFPGPVSHPAVPGGVEPQHVSGPNEGAEFLGEVKKP